MSDSIEIQCEQMIRTATDIENAGQQAAQFQSSFQTQASVDTLRRLCGDDSYGHKIFGDGTGLGAQVGSVPGAMSNVSESMCGEQGFAEGLRYAVKHLKLTDELSGILVALQGGEA
ncbi:hypothetical protein ABIA39_001097 [Nocardia sp. GAS34]|uniref:hypothetical protein n=1 Tax=unclassified Nocardia TaxID=2637762 RepID=UPI003D1B7B93